MPTTNPPLVSYAQNREDLFLWALLAHRTPGTYVDVGCNDERIDSVTRLFYERGWSGINIDANPRFADQYRRRTRDRFVHAGVGSAPAELTFRTYPGHDGLSTFSDQIQAIHSASAYSFVDVTVAVRTLDDILAEHGCTSIDLLKIDVEGFEPEVLAGLDLSAVRPSVVIVEATAAEACAGILLANAYRQEFFDGLNLYFVDERNCDGISIMHFAERVLHAGYYTGREWALMHQQHGVRHHVARAAGAARQRAGELARRLRNRA